MTAIIFRLGRPTSVLSSPGLTGRSSNHRPGILDCQSKSDASDFDHLVSAEVGQARLRVKPGNDTDRMNIIEKRLNGLIRQNGTYPEFGHSKAPTLGSKFTLHEKVERTQSNVRPPVPHVRLLQADRPQRHRGGRAMGD